MPIQKGSISAPSQFPLLEMQHLGQQNAQNARSALSDAASRPSVSIERGLSPAQAIMQAMPWPLPRWLLDNVEQLTNCSHPDLRHRVSGSLQNDAMGPQRRGCAANNPPAMSAWLSGSCQLFPTSIAHCATDVCIRELEYLSLLPSSLLAANTSRGRMPPAIYQFTHRPNSLWYPG